MEIPANPLEMKAEADPLEASFDSLLAAEEHEERIAALETGLDGVKADVEAIRAEGATMRERIERIARTGARPSLGGGEGKAPETKSFVDQYLRRGLRVIAALDDAADEALAALKSGAVRGLSFGYRVRRALGTAPRELFDLDLVEVSLVSVPMMPGARVHMLR